MSIFQKVKQAINDGLEGKNIGLSTGLDRLDDFISIKKRMMITVFGSTGSGKSSLTMQAFVTNPIEEAILQNKKLKIILFSMERSIVFTQAKWLCLKAFKQSGEVIDLGLLLGWKKNKSLNKHQLNLIDMFEDYFDRVEEKMDIYEGQKTPDEIEKIIWKYAEKNGKVENIEGKPYYIPNDPDEHVIIIADHLGLTKVGKHGNKKAAIDTMIEVLQEARDVLGYSIINVSQVNRDLSKSNKDVFEPHLDHLKETGNIAEASDVVISIFDPIRYHTKDMYYGDVNKFRCSISGKKFFRNISILKNTYGSDGIGIGTVFMGETGIIKALPKPDVVNNWQQSDFNKIFNHQYFL